MRAAQQSVTSLLLVFWRLVREVSKFPRMSVWNSNETLALVELWRDEDVEAQLEGVHRNLAVYNRLAELLKLRGYDRSGKQCRNKIKSLKHDYLVDSNARARSGYSGRPRTDIMQILDEILGTRPLTMPDNVVDVAQLATTDRTNATTCTTTGTSCSTDSSSTTTISNLNTAASTSSSTTSSSSVSTNVRLVQGENEEAPDDSLDSSIGEDTDNLEARSKTSHSFSCPEASTSGIDYQAMSNQQGSCNVNDFKKKSRKRKASDEPSISSMLEDFMKKQDSFLDKLLQHEAQQQKLEQEQAERRQAQEFKQQQEMFRMLFGFMSQMPTAMSSPVSGIQSNSGSSCNSQHQAPTPSPQPSTSMSTGQHPSITTQSQGEPRRNLFTSFLNSDSSDEMTDFLNL